MGMASTGVVRAEGVVVTTAISTDEILLQRIDTSTGQRTPRLITAENLLSTTPGGYTPNAVLFANASGDIAGDATNLSFNDSTFAFAATGAITAGTGFTATTGNIVATTGNLIANSIGGGLEIKHGTNGRIGTATLSSGAVTVANTSVTANTIILLTVAALGTVSTAQALHYTISSGVSFTITSAGGTDTSTVGWMLVESL
jgi:hypothetical protein